MHRRAVLVAIAGLSGCTGLVGNPLGRGGASTSGSEGSSGGSGGDATGTASPEPTPAETTEAAHTDVETSTPSAAELRRMSVSDLLVLSRENLSRALETYADAGGGDTLTAVTAATDTFDPEPVVDFLYRARRAYEAAERQGLPAAQQDEIARLGRSEEFLRLAIDAQDLLIEAHNDLEGVVRAIEFVDPETARSLRERARTRHERARAAVAELSNTRYEQSAGTVDALSRDAYRAKRDQLRAETVVLADVSASLPSVVEGVSLFSRAQGRRQSGAPYAAAELGSDAEDAFTAGLTALRNSASRIRPQARGFNGVVSALLTATTDARTAARAFHEEIG
jgi:hypothetical protein